MLSENFKQNAMDLLEKMTDAELEEVLEKIGSIKEERNKESPRTSTPIVDRIRKMDDFHHIFRNIMELHGHCCIRKTFLFSRRTRWLDTAASYYITALYEGCSLRYVTTENHTGGSDPELIGIKQKYSYDGLMYELFGDFKRFGVTFSIAEPKHVWTSTPEFVREIRSMIDEASVMASSSKWQTLNGDFDGDVLPQGTNPPDALVSCFNYLWKRGYTEA